MHWIVCTIFLGTIPISLRAVIGFIIQVDCFKMYSISDFVGFGLLLHISSLHDLESLAVSKSKGRLINLVLSCIAICFYGVFFALSLISENLKGVINSDFLFVSVLILTGVSTLHSFAIQKKTSIIG